MNPRSSSWHPTLEARRLQSWESKPEGVVFCPIHGTLKVSLKQLGFLWGCSRQAHLMERMQMKRWSGSISLDKDLMDVLSFASADGNRWVSWALRGDWSSAWSHGRGVPPRVPESEAWTWLKNLVEGWNSNIGVFLCMRSDVLFWGLMRTSSSDHWIGPTWGKLQSCSSKESRRDLPTGGMDHSLRVGLSSTTFACRNITIDVTEPVPCLHFGAPIFHVPMVFPNGLMLSVLGINEDIEVVEALDLIAQRGYDPTFGARQLPALSRGRFVEAVAHPSCGQGPSSAQLWPMWRLPWLRKVCPVNLMMVTLFLDWNFPIGNIFVNLVPLSGWL